MSQTTVLHGAGFAFFLSTISLTFSGFEMSFLGSFHQLKHCLEKRITGRQITDTGKSKKEKTLFSTTEEIELTGLSYIIEKVSMFNVISFKKIPTFTYWTSCLIFFPTQIYGFSQKLNFSSNILILAFQVLRVGKTVFCLEAFWGRGFSSCNL